MAVRLGSGRLISAIAISVLVLIFYTLPYSSYGDDDSLDISRHNFDSVSMDHITEVGDCYKFTLSDVTLRMSLHDERANRTVSVIRHGEDVTSVQLRVDDVSKTYPLTVALPDDVERLVQNAVHIAAKVLADEQKANENLPDDVISLLEHIANRGFSLEGESSLVFMSESTYARGDELTYYGAIGRDPWRLLHVFIYKDRAIAEVRQTEHGEGRLRVFFADGKLIAAYYGEKASWAIDTNLKAAADILQRALRNGILHVPDEIWPEFSALCSKILESSHYDSIKSRKADAFKSHGIRFGLGTYL